ncbi:MAG TPA: hypothetical protein VFP53_07250 [Sphingomicrobium sp.]|nr:hypothetical protein [Sphingomicrobium sp.]
MLRAILDVEPQSLETSAPTPAEAPIDETLEAEQPDADPAASQCGRMPMVVT